MKTIRIFSILLVLLNCQLATAQIRYKLNLRSQLYLWENDAGNRQNDFYQNVGLWVKPLSGKQLTVKSFFRLARRGAPGRWEEKIYNAYLNWKSDNQKWQVRLGRQFLFHGVIQGSMDGLQVKLQPFQKWQVVAVAGSAVPVDRALQFLNVSDNLVGGLFSDYRFSRTLRANVSYFQKARNGKTIWRQAGVSLSGFLRDFSLFYDVQAEFDLLNSTYQELRFLSEYYLQKWTLRLEVSQQRPRIYEDFLYNMFEIEGYSQLRTGVGYRLGAYRLNLDYILTLFEGAKTNRLIAGVAAGWGSLNLLWQDDHGGKNFGVFGQLNHTFFNKLNIYFSSSYYVYERFRTALNQDATALTAGVNYRLLPPLRLGVQLQQMKNRYYNNDLRGLFQLNYRLKH